MKIAAAIALLLAATAQTAHADDREAASLVVQGVKLLEQRDYKGALNRFREAYDLSPAPRVAARMGFAEQGLGRWAEAEAHLGEALKGNTDAWVNETRAILEKALATVQTRLGWINVTGLPAGARVRIDGDVRGVLPMQRPVRVPTGQHKVTVEADRYRQWEGTATVVTGANVPFTVALDALPVAPLDVPPSGEPPRMGPPGMPVNVAVLSGAPPPRANQEAFLGWAEFSVGAGVVAGGVAARFVGGKASDSGVVSWLLIANGSFVTLMGGMFLADHHFFNAALWGGRTAKNRGNVTLGPAGLGVRGWF